MEEKEKIFLQPGDLVTLKQDLPNKPIMMVVRKETNIFKNQPAGIALRGIRCRWFTTEGLLQEMVASTKDLILLQRASDIKNTIDYDS